MHTSLYLVVVRSLYIQDLPWSNAWMPTRGRKLWRRKTRGIAPAAERTGEGS